MSSFNKTIIVESAVEKLWLIISDIRGMAELYSFMHISDYSKTENLFCYTRQLDIPGLASLTWQETATIKYNTINFHATGGDLTKFNGYWRACNENNETLLTLNVDYDIPSGIGPNVPKFIAEAVLGQIFQKIIDTIKTKAESEE